MIVDRHRQQQRGDRLLEPEGGERSQQVREPDHGGVRAHQHLAALDFVLVVGDHRTACRESATVGETTITSRLGGTRSRYSELGCARLAEEQQVERLEVVGRERLDHRGGAGDLGEGADLFLALRSAGARSVASSGRDSSCSRSSLPSRPLGLEDADAAHGSVLSVPGSATPRGCRSLPRSQSKGPLAA